MNHQSELEKKKYRNWVRGVLAYKYLKEGIEGFADEVVQQDHNRILSAISHTPRLVCNGCCLGNLKPLHNCEKDPVTGKNKCPWGQSSCNCLYPKKHPCSNKVCDRIMEDILKSHGSTPPTPNWKNTDIQKWCSAPWEIAKCFINAPGYSDKTKAADIDSPGLLHVFINNINIQAHLSDQINRSDAFKKTLQRRNELFHSPVMEMEDIKLDECIDEIIAILKDEKKMKARKDAQQAVLKLKQLKQDDFIISTHNEAEVCREALAFITNKSEELKQTIQNAKDDIAEKQSEATKACEYAVASVTNTSEALIQTIHDAQDEFGKKQTEATKAIEDKTQNTLRDALQEFDKHSGTLHERVGQLEIRLSMLENKVDELDMIRQNRQIQLHYVEGKQVLQTKLVELYQNHYVNTSISPLKLQENDINIKDVYVVPEMVVEVKPDRCATNSVENSTNKPKTRTVTQYREILQTNGQKHKQIYIVGDAGTGKSTFCKMMIQNWCSAVTCRDAAIRKRYVNPVIDVESVNVSNKTESSVGGKDESRVSGQEESSVSGKDETRVSDNDESSVSDKDESRVSDKDQSSVSGKNECRVSGKDESSVSGKDESRVSDNDESRASDKDSSVSFKNESSVSNKNESPFSGKDENHVNSKDLSSVCDKDESSVNNDESPVSDKDENSVYNRTESSVSNKDVCSDYDKDENYVKKDVSSSNEMRNYDFLFFVPLKRMTGLSDITAMIKAILTTAEIASNDFIDRIFEQESERCLIVADGLDEWTPPKGASVLQHVSYGLPNRGKATHVTFVTLSRPSAKGILNMRSSECDQKVELLGINVRSMVYFIKTYLSKLNKTCLSYWEFMKKINSANLGHLETNPLLLQQLVWLYGTGNEIGKSISDVYSHLVNIMIGWSQNKEEGDDSEEDQICDTKQDKDMTLPRLLRRFPKCEENKRYLLPLSRVAFEALTSEMGSITFGRSHLRQGGVPKEAIAALIKFGILVEYNCFDPTQEKTQMEFIHISYLEFFAAVYISSHFTVLQDLFQKCKSAIDVLQLSNVLKMMCGLSPSLISEMSKLISDIASEDESMISYRDSLPGFWYRYRYHNVSYQIQRLILNCLSDRDSDDQPMVTLCDVFIDYDTEMPFLQRIVPENVLSLCAYDISDEEVWRWFTRLTRLQYMHIQLNKLPHNKMVLLSSLIQESPLKYLTLDDVQCNISDYHRENIDLSTHALLLSTNGLFPKLEFGYCNREMITNINTKHTEKVCFGYANTSNIDCLLNASSLTELVIKGTGHDYSGYNERVNSVVHTLQNLRKLRLEWVDIADHASAFTATPEMRNLEHIELEHVSMSLQTWCTFVDSLLALQQSVQVDYTFFWNCVCGVEDKRNYVRGNTIMFEVMKDDHGNFSFRTKK